MVCVVISGDVSRASAGAGLPYSTTTRLGGPACLMINETQLSLAAAQLGGTLIMDGAIWIFEMLGLRTATSGGAAQSAYGACARQTMRLFRIPRRY